MKKTIIIPVILIVIAGIVIGIVLTRHNKKLESTTTQSSSSQTSSTENSGSSQTPATGDSGSSASTTPSFTINANDDTADVKTGAVKKGDKVTIVFKVDKNEVYHGGLEFKSDVVNSKPIQPGSSDTVVFTAEKSFQFQPYWYQSDVAKDYQISVNVQ